MPPKNKVISSPHRDEIDKLLLEGESSRNVSDYLENQYNEIISYGTINNYRKDHLNVTQEAKKIYTKRKLKESKKKSKSKSRVDRKAQKSVEKKSKLAEKRSRSRVDKKAQKLVGNIEELDSIIAEMNEVNLEIDETLSGEDIDPIKLLQFKLRCKELEIKAIKIKYDILKDDDSSPVINVNINEKLDRLKRIEHNVNNADE